MKELSSVNTFNGMDLDTSNYNIEETDYRYALNMSFDKNIGTIINSNGTDVCVNLPSTYRILGHVLIDNDYILFIKSGTSSLIVKYYPDSCNYTVLLNEDCLDFKEGYPVSCLYKQHNGCEDLVYFTDNRNEYRVINLSKLSEYTNGSFDCSLLSINKYSFELDNANATGYVEKRNFGGTLKLGKYIVYRRLLDFMSNATDWHYLEEVDITQDISKSVYTEQGGFNIIESDLEIGSYKPTSCSLKINSSYTEKKFRFIQYAIMEYNTNDGSLANIALSPKINIFKNPSFSNSSTWIYDGTNSIGSITINELAVDKKHIGIVKAHELNDNRLFLANIRYDKDYDWASVQQSVNDNINVLWANKPVAKTSKKYIRTYMRDEVYAFGIQGTLKDGRKTPVFHIPGRRKMNSEIGTQTPNQRFNTNALYSNPIADKVNVDNNPFKRLRPTWTTGSPWDDWSVSASGLNTDTINPLQTSLWNNVNTAIEVGNVNIGGVTSKVYTSSYIQNDEIYPSILDCNGNDFYGTILGEAVRHHKAPDHNIAPAFDKDNMYALLPYLLYDNISAFKNSLPQDIKNDVIEWYLMDAVKTDKDKTIIDKGYTTYREAGALFYGFIGDPWAELENDTCLKNVLKIYTPKTLINKDIANPNYLKVEYAEKYTGWFDVNPLSNTLYPRKGMAYQWDNDSNNGEHLSLAYWLDDYAHITSNTIKYNYNILQAVNIEPTNPFVPNSYTRGNLYDVNERISINILFSCNSFTIKGDFTTLHNIVNTPSTITGEPIITYSALKNLNNVHYLDTIVYNKNAKLMGYTLYEKNANCFVSPMTWTLSNRGCYTFYPMNFGDSVKTRRILEKESITTSHEVFFRYVESEINFGLRHASNQRVFPEVNSIRDDYSGRFYRGPWLNTDSQFPNWSSNWTNAWTNYSDDFFYSFNNYIRRGTRIDLNNNVTNIIDRFLLTPEYFGYNYSYSFKYSPKIYIGITKDYCDECQSNNPYEIIYSSKSFQNDAIDSNQIFLPNNGSVLDSKDGGINKLFENFNKLYAITDKSLWLIPTRPQQMQSNESIINIGIGDVFSIPPVKINNSDNVFTGGKNISLIKTVQGTFYLNNDIGRLYLLKESPVDVGDKCSIYLQKNLKYKFKEQLSKKMNIVDYDDAELGLTTMMSYDNENSVLYITKKDYALTDAFYNSISLINYNKDTGTYSFIDTNNVTYTFNHRTNLHSNFLEDDSIIGKPFIKSRCMTISYNLKRSRFVSFHSFIPNYYLSLNNGIASIIYSTNTTIYKHTNNENRYYGSLKGSSLELVSNKDVMYNKILNEIQISGNYSTVDILKDIIVYDSYQINYPRTCYLVTGMNVPSNVIPVTYKEGLFNINILRSSNNNAPISGEYPYEAYSSASTTNQFEWSRFLDTYFIIRINFKDIAHKISISNIKTSKTISIR